MQKITETGSPFTLAEECSKLTRYLIGKEPTAQVYLLFEKAHHHIAFEFAEKEKKLWNRCMRNSFLLYCVDAALATNKRASAIRKKIFVLLAILESVPDYHQHFLPAKRSPLYFITVFFISVKARAAALAGKIILFFSK
jgi:hypothetical protein